MDNKQIEESNDPLAKAGWKRDDDNGDSELSLLLLLSISKTTDEQS